MTELTLEPRTAAAPAGDKQLAVPGLPLPAPRRKGEPRARRRYSATRLAPLNDGGFRPFRVY